MVTLWTAYQKHFLARHFSIFLTSAPSFSRNTVIRIMAKTIRLLKSFSRLVLPLMVLVTLAVAPASVLLVREMSRPTSAIYLVTPQKYGQLSSRGTQITDENWSNADNTSARGIFRRANLRRR